ncbi:MAG: NIPSNAP family containing protein [Planctomycetes bacterium]|nr:NIPSNAP family containing protein [Planctomycetota bacterium]
MRRRDLLGGTCLAGSAALAAMAGTAGGGEAAAGARELLELRLYRAEAGEMRGRLDKFLAEAAIPAWNRIGIRPVGVFAAADDSTADLYVVMSHKTAESFAAAPARLEADAEYRKAGAALLDTPKTSPTYLRIETSLMLAFEQAPRLEAPVERKPGRVFQLRIYESHCDERARLKIDMFNGGGEISIFRRAGLTWVFFGQTLAGAKMPNLTYMVGFADDDARKAAWDRFGKDPEWVKLRADRKYADTVSTITNIVLKPTAYSQI